MLFTKMHGLGNDFILIEEKSILGLDYRKLAEKMCDRHFGVGADGILIVGKSDIADSKMHIYNSDGSLAEMCGNGIRCFAKYLYEKKLIDKDIVRIETLDGVKEIRIEADGNIVKNVCVNMGVPGFTPVSIPADFDTDTVINNPVEIDGEIHYITSMLMGVPHTILFVDSLDDNQIVSLGSKIEKSKYFPKKTNVNFVKVLSRTEFYVRTWERGAGPTLACGTGTCASLVACVLNGKTERKATAHLSGGDMFVEWSESSEVYMTGPAETIFTGEYIV